ncbi:urease accessory protein UreD [Methylovirgula sp. 4M-Z18]|uniref:urease accessory protein UreD n=1 Tax=Methylovirgula sp. 4M-Z18 TaxID=2293567 RepID=UPI000E2FD1FA|nr:urease accessory protein UreD [Methylovirgula sp. 4M-Z18]RFB79193.1 urease accessory protein UreD [Methylovirgula sp. 4M-Z18]
MSALTCPSEGIVPAYVRAKGEIRARFAATAGRTRLMQAYEHGGLRLRCPHVASGCEAVLINTGGGMAGGDHASYSFIAEAKADLTVTTQSAEKIYRSQGATTQVGVTLQIGAEAGLEWLPQETILFDQALLSRRLDASLETDSSLTLMESVVFGRLARSETVHHGIFRDRWRVKRNGHLIFAEDVRLSGPIASILDRRACGNGARMVATLLHVAPDAESKLEVARAALQDSSAEAGASAWNGMLLVRLISPSPEHVRASIVSLLAALRRRSAPRVWQ